jgi:hypothetical protein
VRVSNTARRDAGMADAAKAHVPCPSAVPLPGSAVGSPQRAEGTNKHDSPIAHCTALHCSALHGHDSPAYSMAHLVKARSRSRTLAQRSSKRIGSLQSKAKQGKPAEGTFSGTARLPRTACHEHGGRGYIAVHCGRVAAYIKGKLAPAGVRGILTEVRAPYRVHVTVCASLQ